MHRLLEIEKKAGETHRQDRFQSRETFDKWDFLV
jgi:hypothetical protein